ncbi:MAG: hypothetical protein AB1772_07930 [Candidatus Zixiibacteriota bacterium]
MKSNVRQFAIVAMTLATVWPSVTTAGSLAGRTRLEIGAGWRHHPEQTARVFYVDDQRIVTATEGAVGRLGLSYWSTEELAFAVDYTLHDVEVDNRIDSYGYSYDHASIVHSLMFGMRLYWPQSRPYAAMRPYFSAGAGPFFGTSQYWFDDECDCDRYGFASHMVVAGARLGGGIDFLMGRNFMFGFNGGYNFVEDFSRPIGGRYDYSGSDFGMSVSFLFGGRRIRRL